VIVPDSSAREILDEAKVLTLIVGHLKAVVGSELQLRRETGYREPGDLPADRSARYFTSQ